MDTLQGIVSKITYYNEDNGFGVIKVKLDFRNHSIAKFKSKLFNETLVITGYFPRQPLIDEEYQFSGEFVQTQYGLQFKSTEAKQLNETSLNSIVTYLSSEFFPGIGKVIATRIYDTLGENCLDMIINDKDVLNQVPGISTKQKESLVNNLFANQTNKKAMVKLLELGISVNLCIKLLHQYGDDASLVVKENPYKLINEVEGISFIKADKIALTIGIEENSLLRLKEYLMYIINKECYQSGCCYIEEGLLWESVDQFLNKESSVITKENYEKVLNILGSEKRLHIDKEKRIFDSNIYRAESHLAKCIHRILSSDKVKSFSEKEITRCLEAINKAYNINYNPTQLEAIKKALKEPITIITGGPGTGKSTIIRAIKDCYSELYGNDLVLEQVYLLAPTGRAAKRLMDVAFHPAYTIHKFLGYEGHGVYRYGYNQQIDCKMVIIDEFSMVDILLASRLFAALNPGTKIVIVGDSDQLPSVGPGNVLEDLITTGEVTTTRLTQIHRQVSGSSIISLAHEVNSGVLPETILEKQNDRNFISLPDNNIVSGIIKTIEQGLSKQMNLITDIQVLVPLYRSEIGINAINAALQAKFNPLENISSEYSHLGRKFRTNDKVLQLVNRSEKKVMNGDIGQIIYMEFTNNDLEYLDVSFDHGIVRYTKLELEDLTHAYAISVHKAQGSEFPLVIMPFSYRYYVMLKRKLIYTGITRAKKYLVMLGNIEAFQKGITLIEDRRRTALVEKIKNHFDNNVIDDGLSAFDDISENMENLSPYDFLD